jgi:hypothetical protein
MMTVPPKWRLGFWQPSHACTVFIIIIIIEDLYCLDVSMRKRSNDLKKLSWNMCWTYATIPIPSREKLQECP